MEDSTKEDKNILLLFEEGDAKQWADHIYKEFTDKEPKITGVESKDLNTNIGDVATLCSQYTVVVLVISPEMLDTLVTQHKQLKLCLAKHKNIVGIKLFLEDCLDKLNGDILPKYPHSKSWSMFDITGREEQVTHTVSNIRDILQNANELASSPQPVPVKRPSNFIKAVSPDSIRQGGETVTVILSNPLPGMHSKTIQVALGSHDSTKIETEILNEYCFSFKAPAHAEGKVNLYLFIDGTKRCKRPIFYSPMRKFAYTFPEFLCQLLCFEASDRERLDQYLASVFKNSIPQDNSIGKMLTPKNIAAEAGRKESEEELPTLLHFACKYDLTTLATSILDTSGAFQALGILNKDKMSPLDIAEQMGNQDLVNYIEAFLEMQDYMTDIEDIYEKMSNGRSLQEHAVQPGYMEMSSRNSVESYTTARVPDSDYEITGGQGMSPAEVPVEDDITESTPPPVPERKISGSGPPVSPRPPVSVGREWVSTPPIPARQSVTHRSGESRSLTTSVCALPTNDPMAGTDTMSPYSMGSSSLQELYSYMEDFKRGELNMSDCEKLYRAWQDRNRDHTPSIKEKKEQLDRLKECCQKAKGERGIQKKKEGGFLSRFTKRRKDSPTPLRIEHNVSTMCTSYETWDGFNRPPSRRDSIVSTTSTCSSSSSSSRDSMLDPVTEKLEESDSDQEEQVQRRRRSQQQESVCRNSWGNQYIQLNLNPNVCSRLPKPPPKIPVPQPSLRGNVPREPPIPARKPILHPRKT